MLDLFIFPSSSSVPCLLRLQPWEHLLSWFYYYGSCFGSFWAEKQDTNIGEKLNRFWAAASILVWFFFKVKCACVGTFIPLPVPEAQYKKEILLILCWERRFFQFWVIFVLLVLCWSLTEILIMFTEQNVTEVLYCMNNKR